MREASISGSSCATCSASARRAGCRIAGRPSWPRFWCSWALPDAGWSRFPQARIAFTREWQLRCKAVSASFAEAGDELFTFIAFPMSQWKALRTTNALEPIYEEFRRRTKTQASLPSEEAVPFMAAWSAGKT